MMDRTQVADPSIYYYDSDYPSSRDGGSNFDRVAHAQGIAFDIDRYEGLAETVTTPILEVGCGTGRVAIPLARKGHRVIGVDKSPSMLAQFEQKLANEPAAVRARVQLANVNIVDFQGPRVELAILAFNSLLFMASEQEQQAALACVARHLLPNGRLAIDIINHKVFIAPEGVAEPRAHFTRRNVHNGNAYTRFDCVSACDAEGRQRIYGHYVEVEPEGAIESRPYEITWRPLTEASVRSMLAAAGLVIDTIEGGHQCETFTEASKHMLILARPNASLQAQP